MCRTVDQARTCSDNAAPAGMDAAVDEDVEREATVDCANAVADDRESLVVATSSLNLRRYSHFCGGSAVCSLPLAGRRGDEGDEDFALGSYTRNWPACAAALPAERSCTASSSDSASVVAVVDPSVTPYLRSSR